jgi:hypothetical protein
MTRAVARIASLFVCAFASGCVGSNDDPGGGGSGGIDPSAGTRDDTTGGSSSTAASSSESSGGSSSSASSSEGESSSEGSTEGATGSSSGDDTGSTSEMLEGSGTTMDCPSATVDFEPVVPTVVLLIDQSGSMTENFNGQTRWNAVRDALIDPETGVIATLEDDVRFGLALYTSVNGDAGGTCPILTEVAPMVANFDAIADMYDDADPSSETPTGESIEAVAAALAADPDTNPKFIVLATDGEPDTCAQPNPQNGQEESVAATEAAFAAGIQTFVISVGNDVSAGHLQDVANAGIGWMPGDEDAEYYVPSDQDAMAAAFEDIVNGVRSCVLTLDSAILPGQGDQGTVTVNGMVIPYDDPNGWRVNSPTEIELLGDACALIQAGDVDVQVEFTCHAILPG